MRKALADRITLVIVSRPGQENWECGKVIFLLTADSIELCDLPVSSVTDDLKRKGYGNVARHRQMSQFSDEGISLSGQGKFSYNLTLTTEIQVEVWEKKLV